MNKNNQIKKNMLKLIYYVPESHLELTKFAIFFSIHVVKKITKGFTKN